MKKLRQKGQKAKELSNGEKVDSENGVLDTAEGSFSSPSTPSPRGPSESELSTSEASLNQDPLSLEQIGSMDTGSNADLRQPLHAEVADQSSAHQLQTISEHRKPTASHRPHPKQNKKSLNGFHNGQVQATKSSGFMRHGNYRDLKSANGYKIWTPKSKPEAEGANERETVIREQSEEVVLCDKEKVMVGSISVELDGDNNPQHATLRLDSFEEKLVKPDSSRTIVKLWRLVSCHGSGNTATAESKEEDTKMDGDPAVDQSSSMASAEMGDGAADSCKDSKAVNTSRYFSEPRLFSREVAEAFLAQS